LRSRLADYQLLGPAGPSSDSWLATAPARIGISEPVVVTELAPGDWPARAARLSSLAAVRSPWLPRLIEAGETDEEDGPVAWVVRTDGRAPAVSGPASDPESVLRGLAAAARGAHDLHEAGWVHGDIRPGAILRRGDDTLLEPPIRTVATPGRTIPSGVTPADLDPLDPVTVWGEGPSRSSDIWALGATAHRLLTGTHVHPALPDDPIVTAVQRVLVEVPVVVSSLPAAVAELLRSCLAPDPADRPGTAADLADGFTRAAGR
jgi:serine/threonine protein kinase